MRTENLKFRGGRGLPRQPEGCVEGCFGLLEDAILDTKLCDPWDGECLVTAIYLD